MWGSGSWGAAGLPYASCRCSQQPRADQCPVMQPHQPPAPPGTCMTASLRMQAWAQSPQALPPPPALPEDTPERGPHISKVSLQAGSCRPQDPASQNLAEPVPCGCSCNSEAVQPEMRASVPELPHSLGGGASAPASVGLGIDATSDNSCLRPPCKTRVSTGRWVVPQTDGSRRAQKRRVWASSPPPHPDSSHPTHEAVGSARGGRH